MSRHEHIGPDLRLSRRDALKMAAAGGGGLAVSSLLAACGGSSSSSPSASSTASAGKPKRGGTLRVGVLGGSSSDSLEADSPLTYLDNARVANLYDPLLTFDRDAKIEYDLAEEVTAASKDAMNWVIKIKPGIEFHDGSPFTSESVKFTLQRIVKMKLNGQPLLALADVENIKILDKNSLSVPMHAPVSVFDEILASPWAFQMVPVGYDPKKPVGTGPFKFQSFSAGQQSVFVRNDNYWDHGMPYLDQLVLIDASDPTSQTSGIQGGQFDAIDQVTPASVSGLNGAGINTTVSKGYAWNPITMRVDQAPFNDVRVRQAFRLILDRPKAADVAIGGYGAIGNDLFAPFDPTYNHNLPQRVQDIDQAKSLLKQAGHDSLTVTMTTSNQIGVGIYETAQVFAEQAKAANVNVNLQELTQSAFYGPNFVKYTFAQDDWSLYSYLVQVYYSMLPTSQYNETHFADPKYIKLAASAIKELDLAKADRDRARDAVDRVQHRRLHHSLLHGLRGRDDQEGRRNAPVPNGVALQQLPLQVSVDGIAARR